MSEKYKNFDRDDWFKTHIGYCFDTSLRVRSTEEFIKLMEMFEGRIAALEASNAIHQKKIRDLREPEFTEEQLAKVWETIEKWAYIVLPIEHAGKIASLKGMLGELNNK